jgi:hypothetical protein
VASRHTGDAARAVVVAGVEAAAGRAVIALTAATAATASRWRASSMVPPGEIDRNPTTISYLE